MGSAASLVLTALVARPHRPSPACSAMMALSPSGLSSIGRPSSRSSKSAAGKAQRRIVHLTLIAGFASTLLWPLTTCLHDAMSWREVLLLLRRRSTRGRLPLHWALRPSDLRLRSPSSAVSGVPVEEAVKRPSEQRACPSSYSCCSASRSRAMRSSAMLVHIVPLTQALGLGAAGLVVASLFGPAQVASRLINLIFGNGRYPRGMARGHRCGPDACRHRRVVRDHGPSFAGAVVFAILHGPWSGVDGSRRRRGAGSFGQPWLRIAALGWLTSAKQLTSALAPFAMAASMSEMGVVWSLWLVAAVGVISALAFVGIQLTVEPRFARSTADGNA